MINFDDKRDFYRMLLNSEATVTIIDDEANSKIFATCRDLSATGMAFEMTHPIELGTEVRVNIEAASSGVQAFDASGKIVRVIEENPESYLVGISILEID